jgi:lysozyme family protein
MADFLKAILKVEKDEGGYTDNPKDAGNYYPQNIKTGKLIGTNKGITPTTYKTAFGHVPSVSEMKALGQKGSRAILKQLYWDKIMGDKIKSQEFAELMFDSAVNQGVPTAIKAIQTITGHPTTGTMNADTLSGINNTPFQDTLFNKFRDWRIDVYSKGNADFSKQWIERVKRYKKQVGIGALVVVGLIGVGLYFLYQNKAKIISTGKSLIK